MAYNTKAFTRLEEVLDKQFPKGDKVRGRALVLFGEGMREITLAEVRAVKEFKEESAQMLKQDLKEKLKQKLKDSKDDWIVTLHKEFKEEMIDSL